MATATKAGLYRRINYVHIQYDQWPLTVSLLKFFHIKINRDNISTNLELEDYTANLFVNYGRISYLKSLRLRELDFWHFFLLMLFQCNNMNQTFSRHIVI